MWTWLLVALLLWVLSSAAVGLTLGRVVRARDRGPAHEPGRVSTTDGPRG